MADEREIGAVSAELRRIADSVGPGRQATVLIARTDLRWLADRLDAARSTGVESEGASLIDRMRSVARECGYAIAVHGSEKRDLDLVAVPWTDEATEAAWLVDELCEDIPLVVRDNPPEGWPPDQRYLNPEHRPHGRTSWVLLGSSDAYIDLAVMPREHQPPEAQRIARAIADWGSPHRRWEDRHPKNQRHWLLVAEALMSNHPSIIDPVLAYVRAAKAGRDPSAALDAARSTEPEGLSERGFAQFGEVTESYGGSVRVYESSSAEAPHVWLLATGEAHLDGPVREHPGISHGVAPGGVAAHLTCEQAEAVRNLLGEFLAYVAVRVDA